MRTPSGSRQIACELCESVCHYVNRYALAAMLAVGSLALAWPAEARIVYTPTNVTITTNIFHKQAAYGLDINNDGVIDFTIVVLYFPLVPCVGGGFGAIAGVSETPAAGNGADGPPAALETGGEIGTGQTYNGRQGELKAYRGCHGGFEYGEFGSQKRYLGLMFRVKGNTYFGWAQLSVIANGAKASATVTGYAYENTPGAPIKAGQTTEAEESSALRPDVAYPGDSDPGASITNPRQAKPLGMLALGAQDLPLWRRNESIGPA